MAKRKVFNDFDPAPAGPTVSETLRDTRMAHGYDLRDVAAMLRIRYPYLLAIEEGRYGDLPGSAYAVGFLRSYAECLGLDPDTVVARYKEEAAGTVRRQELYLPTPAAEGRASGGTLLLGTLVLAGIVYGGWYYLSTTDRSVADLVPTLPDRLVSLLDGVPSRTDHPPAADATAPAAAPATPPAASSSAPAAAPPAPAPAPSVPMPVAPSSVASTTPPAPAAAPASGAAKPAVPAPAVTASNTTPAAAPAKPPAAAAAPAPTGIVNVPAPPAEDDEEGSPQEPTSLATAAAPPAAPAAPAAETVPANGKVYGTLNTNAKLILKATQESWLQVRDGSEIVFTRVLKPGDTFRVPDKPNVKIRTGNAGGLVVMADGAESPPLGSVGQVLRDVTIDQRGLVRR